MSRIIREAQSSDMADIMTVMDAAKGIMQHNILKHGFTYRLPGDRYLADTTDSPHCRLSKC